MHAYSVPERLTPSRRMVWPLPLVRWLPDTPIESGVDAKAGDGAIASARKAAENITIRGRLPLQDMPQVSQPLGSKAMRVQ